MVSTGRMKSGITGIPMADSVAIQADCIACRKGRTHSVSRDLPERPCNVTAKGWPLLVVLVCQQTPRRLVLVRDGLFRRIPCRSPNLRPPCKASSRPPRKSRRSCGQCGLEQKKGLFQALQSLRYEAFHMFCCHAKHGKHK